MENLLSLFGGGTDKIWDFIRDGAKECGAESTRMALELFYVLKNSDTSIIDKSLIVAALAYQFLPEDLLPRDKFGLLGFLDNGVTLAFAYNRVKSLVTPEIENHVDLILSQWFVDSSNNDGGVGTDQGSEQNKIPQDINLEWKSPKYIEHIENPKKPNGSESNDDVIVD
jgi:uncharacterized membrane protein YkvA (DUF1232 family)